MFRTTMLRRLFSTSATSAVKQKVARIGGVRADGKSIRWYREAEVEAERGDATRWLIKLDGRVVVTPKERVLIVPNQSLALLVAGEWERQQERVVPHTMPMMTLATSLVDEAPAARTIMIGNICAFLRADAACIRSANEEVAAEQAKLLDGVVAWFQRRYHVPLAVVGADKAFDFGAAQDNQTVDALQWALFSESDATLVGVEALAQCMKSSVLALAVVADEMSPEEAFDASRVEEMHNISKWGYFEGPSGQDVDEADLKARVSSAALFMRLARIK